MVRSYKMQTIASSSWHQNERSLRCGCRSARWFPWLRPGI